MGSIRKDLHPALQNLYSSLPLKVIFHPAEKGGYWAEAPDLPTCYSYGESLQEIMQNMKVAVFDYFDVPKRFQNLEKLVYESEEEIPIQYVDPAPLSRGRVKKDIDAELLVSV